MNRKPSLHDIFSFLVVAAIIGIVSGLLIIWYAAALRQACQ